MAIITPVVVAAVVAVLRTFASLAILLLA